MVKMEKFYIFNFIFTSNTKDKEKKLSTYYRITNETNNDLNLQGNG